MDITEIKPGDVLFVWGESFIDDCIELVTHGPSHCALFINNKTLAEAQGGRTIGEAQLSDYLATGDRLEVWRDESLTDEEREKMIAYAKSQYGMQYDYTAIAVEFARYELHMPISLYHEGKRRICSSYVYDCAKAVSKIWALGSVPAPEGLIDGGKLKRECVLNHVGGVELAH